MTEETLQQMIQDQARETDTDEGILQCVLAGLPEVPDQMMEAVTSVLDHVAKSDRMLSKG